MGHRFSLVLSRTITADESATLRDAACSGAVFSTDSLPTNADAEVTKMDFDDTISSSLAEAIESALEAVKMVPDLSVPGLTVPAQPAQASGEQPTATIMEEPAKADATEPAVDNGHAAASGNGHATGADEAAQAATVAAGRQ